MDSYLKLTSTKTNKNCNCISPFYINNISGINPNTGRSYTNEDQDILKTALYRISTSKGCNVSVCCDPDDPTSQPDAAFTAQFLNKFPKILPMYQGSNLVSIKLSTTSDVKTSGWQTPSTQMICKITKATISDTTDPTIKIATNLVKDCYTDNCNQAETITMSSLLQNSKVDMKYTYIDDARVTQAIKEGNIKYVKEYIRQYKGINMPLTNDDYNNRMIHIASESDNIDILNMLIALKANINITNKIKETPMHFAVRSKNLNNIDALISQGVDLSIATMNGETAMFYAMKTGDMRIINLIYNGGSSIMSIDKHGDNLIHYCIKNCPSFEDSDPNSTNVSNSIPNQKSDIIRFLIEHGISTEQKNLDGITPLEMVGKHINRQINKECSQKKANEDAIITEAFFNVNGTNNNGTNNNGIKNKEHFANGAIKQDISRNTIEHDSLLEIQTLLFNNIIANNPKKYGGYISVDDIPKGSPIEVLDTVCVGDGMTGNEDSNECVEKGGQLVKIKNRTTKIKLELIPNDDTIIDKVERKDLYYKKIGKKEPSLTLPSRLQKYNDSVKNATIANTIPQTTGITYSLGQESSNALDDIETKLGFNPKPTVQTVVEPTFQSYIDPPRPTKNNISNSDSNSDSNSNSNSNSNSLHPPVLDQDVIQKCQRDAINNATKISIANTIANTVPQTTQSSILSNASSIISNYKIYIIASILSIIIIFIIYIIYKNKFTANVE